ncbi:MAG: hypothetical protein H6721_07010 [Sandaracinus sp.]|nr:hypothetical protein [Sandaracinus sp.]
MHAVDYRNGRGLASGKRALVVGSGNSGAEITLDLRALPARTSMAIPASDARLAAISSFGVVMTQVVALGYAAAEGLRSVELPLTKRSCRRSRLRHRSATRLKVRWSVSKTGCCCRYRHRQRFVRQGRITVFPASNDSTGRRETCRRSPEPLSMSSPATGYHAP